MALNVEKYIRSELPNSYLSLLKVRSHNNFILQFNKDETLHVTSCYLK